MLIIISGKARHGKDTFGEFMAGALFKQSGQCYVLVSFAHEMKTMIQKEFDLSWDQLWGEEKEREDERYPKNDKFWTAREILQQYGEFYRSINYNFWVKKLFFIIGEKEYSNIIITDGRYPNEISAVKERDGYHIRITRDAENKIHGEQHSSETSLDEDYKVDFSVSNNGTLNHLREIAANIAGEIVKIENTKKN